MKKLSKQPLVEVVFELHWKSKKGYPDPDYRLLIGALYDHIKSEFPAFETLPTASIPEEAIRPDIKVIQYRFWSKNKTYPIAQLGPGIITVNMNKDYDKWETFKPVIEKVLDNFLRSHPDLENLILERLALRYLDSFPLDFKAENVLDYLKDRLHLELSVDLGDERANLPPAPVNVDIKLEYQITDPEGILGFRFFKAPIEGRETLAMETYVISTDFPPLDVKAIGEWLDKAHNMTDFIFFNLIRGKLLEELR